LGSSLGIVARGVSGPDPTITADLPDGRKTSSESSSRQLRIAFDPRDPCDPRARLLRGWRSCAARPPGFIGASPARLSSISVRSFPPPPRALRITRPRKENRGRKSLLQAARIAAPRRRLFTLSFWKPAVLELFPKTCGRNERSLRRPTATP
jgi:hypothetical protein